MVNSLYSMLMFRQVKGNVAQYIRPLPRWYVDILIVGAWVDFHYLVMSTNLDGLRFIVGPGISAGFIIITFTQYNTGCLKTIRKYKLPCTRKP